MNREIKFRAWDKRQKCFQTWEFISSIATCGMILNYEHDNYFPQQFTGLKDKNGKEIYEGDIVGVDNEVQIITVCSFDLGQFNLIDTAGGYWTRQLYHQPDRLEVLGNQFENPELLCP